MDVGARGQQQGCSFRSATLALNALVQPLADHLVSLPGRGAQQRGAVQDFVVGLAHFARRTLRRKRPVCERLLRRRLLRCALGTIGPPPSLPPRARDRSPSPPPR